MSEQPQRRKRGRYIKNGYFKWAGAEIVGLKRRPDGRFYAAANPDKKFGKDPALAVHRFNQWKADQENESEPFDPFEANSGMGSLVDAEREYIRNLILFDPRQASVELNIPELAYFHELKPPPDPTMTLEALGKKYHDEKRNKRGKPLAPDHKRQSIVWWDEFLSIIGVSNAQQIAQSLIVKYRDTIMAEFDNGKAPTYVKLRFGKVKTIFAFGVDNGIDVAELRRVLDLCRILIVPADNPVDPQPIAPADFQALLDAADVRQTAILLCGLNFCMHSSEVAALQKSELKNGTLVTQRSKTGITRIAVVWKRTRKAVDAYLRAKSHNGKHLFNSRIGTALTAKAVGRMIQSLRQKAELPESVSFDTIRDGAYSAAIEAGADLTQAKLLAGHKVGMADHYVRRNSKMVSDCCEAIESHFFGNQT